MHTPPLGSPLRLSRCTQENGMAIALNVQTNPIYTVETLLEEVQCICDNSWFLGTSKRKDIQL